MKIDNRPCILVFPAMCLLVWGWVASGCGSGTEAADPEPAGLVLDASPVTWATGALGCTVTARVVDDAGTPIAGVELGLGASRSEPVIDPATGTSDEGGEVAFVFPSGWRVSVPFQLFAPGQFAVGLDEASFHRVLDELGTPGALEISAGGGRITIAVPDQLDGRIRNLRGPLPEGSPMTEPCLAQLAGG